MKEEAHLGKSRSTVSVLGKIRKISLTNVGPPLTNDNDNDARLLSLRPGSLDAAGPVAAIFANLLAGQCLRPQRLAGGLDTSRVVATLHPVVSTRCTLCGCGIRPPCASPTDLSHASPRSAAPRTAHDASRSRVEGEGSLPLT